MSPVSLFRGVRPIRRQEVLNDVLAGITLAALGIPEVMGYTKIAETPVVAGLYTLLLPVVAFAVLGASRISGFGDCSDPRGDARDGRRAPVSGVRGADGTGCARRSRYAPARLFLPPRIAGGFSFA